MRKNKWKGKPARRMDSRDLREIIRDAPRMAAELRDFLEDVNTVIFPRREKDDTNK